VSLMPRKLPIKRAGAAALLGVLAVWAMWPLPEPTVDAGLAPSAPVAPEPVALAALDLDAFRTPLWVAPPVLTPVPPESAPERLPPVRLQLIAIVRDPGDASAALKALLYDPDSDRLILAAPGEVIGAATIEHVLERGVEVRDRAGGGVRTLALRPDEPSAAGGGR
jgi:hypothetical protein